MTNPNSIDQSLRVADLVASAESFAKRREWALAEAQFRQALSLDSTPRSQIAYGVFLAQRERYFEAISIFTRVLDGDDRTAIGIVCHNLAAIYREVGDLDLARRFQWRATLLHDDLGAEEMLGMANDAIVSERHEVAESLVTAARVMASDEEGEETSDADLMATMGLVQAAMNSPEEGLFTLFAAYRCHQAVHDLRGMGADLLNMASQFGFLKRFRAERGCIVRAIRCFEQASAPFSYKKARRHLARFDQMQLVHSFDVRRN